MTNCVSPLLVQKIVQANGGKVDYRHIRFLWDGLPAFVCERVIGRAVFSASSDKAEVPSDEWRRGREDTVASRAPRTFVPGFDLVAALEDRLRLEVIPGTHRLWLDEPPDPSSGQSLQVRIRDLLILDTRLLRRSTSPARRMTLSVVRAWIVPAEVRAEARDPDVPPRAALFFGRESIPSDNLRDWLCRTSPPRE